LIKESLEKMRNIGTMLICAHRLSTIKNADNIIVMQHGRIVESGTHAQLLESGGYYSKLHALQAERQ
ncbi:MAG: ABC transporter ATP-binding protein, partial [Clostridia bacterium]|nr:ABC transporter ATP-binding protein [Clostridia bacterium]